MKDQANAPTVLAFATAIALEIQKAAKISQPFFHLAEYLFVTGIRRQNNTYLCGAQTFSEPLHQI